VARTSSAQQQQQRSGFWFQAVIRSFWFGDAQREGPKRGESRGAAERLLSEAFFSQKLSAALARIRFASSHQASASALCDALRCFALLYATTQSLLFIYQCCPKGQSKIIVVLAMFFHHPYHLARDLMV